MFKKIITWVVIVWSIIAILYILATFGEGEYDLLSIIYAGLVVCISVWYLEEIK